MNVKLTKDNYREYKAINYSLLSKLSFDPSQVKQDQKETEAMGFGSLFDCLITDSDRFDSEYVVSDVEKPTAQLGEFLDIFLGCSLEDKEEKYKYAHAEMKLRNPKLRDGVDKFIERMESEASPYLEFLENSKDKKVVSKDDFYLATRMKDGLKNNQFTRQFFDMSYDWETKFQVPLEGVLGEHKFKGLLDMLLINEAKKEIIPIDIKTTSSYPNQFEKSVAKWNYLIQAALYYDLVQLNYPDYKIHDFTFLVSSKVLPDKPFIWVANDLARSVGKHGTTLPKYEVKGYMQLADDLKWHEDSGLWEYPRSTYENNGFNIIDFFL